MIIAPKFALYVWQTEIQKWLGASAFIYTGTPTQRRKNWKQFIDAGGKFLITNYALVGEIANLSGVQNLEYRTALKDKGNFKWKAIVCDEAHLGGLFNYKNKTYKIIQKLCRRIPIRYILTGTPYRQGCKDLFGPLSLVDNESFDSYWKFVYHFCVVTKTPFGKSIERNPANLMGFRDMVHKFMIRRIKSEVLDELPEKNRQVLYADMNNEQRKIYKELTETLIAEIPDTDDVIITPSQLSLITRQRQLLVCPQVLGLKKNAGALDTIVEHSHLTLDNDKPIVIFTPFRKGIMDIVRAFKKEYGAIPCYVLRGQMTAKEFGDTWQGFQNSKVGKRIMICVIKSGASFQATAASTAYFLGFEWDFTLNEQAEDRLYRMGQKDNVNIYYVITKNTVDEMVREKLNEKKISNDLVVGSERQFIKMLRKFRGK